MTTQLSASQHAILAHAIHHTEGRLNWFPDNIKGGARKKVIDALSNRALITRDGVHWCVAAEGYDALGMQRPAPARGPITLAALDAVIANAEAAQAKAAKPRMREGSKQAQVIAMLQRPEGRPLASSARPPAGSSIRCVVPWPDRSRKSSGSPSPRKNQRVVCASTKSRDWELPRSDEPRFSNRTQFLLEAIREPS